MDVMGQSEVCCFVPVRLPVDVCSSQSGFVSVFDTVNSLGRDVNYEVNSNFVQLASEAEQFHAAGHIPGD